MHLIRRGPHSDFGAGYERKTFLCPKCNVEIERSADKPLDANWLTEQPNLCSLPPRRLKALGESEPGTRPQVS
jgi:hypothetical protein